MNAFRLNGQLNREYLRICAVYRCFIRYGRPKEWAVEKITEKTRNRALATATVEGWMQTQAYRRRAA